MASDPGGLPPLAVNTTTNSITTADDISTSTNRNLSSNAVSTTNTPLSSAPASPSLSRFTRRPSQPAVSPLSHPSPRPQSRSQRPSSAASVNHRPPPSPSLNRKTSRSSLHGQTEDVGQRPTPKRSISNLVAGLRDSHSTMEAIEEPIPLTASQIAVSHFARELGAHTLPQSSAETVVIVHDACYGHRFSRPKTTKTILSLIVERPERILASVLGVSAAYVRLGGHHAGGVRAPHPDRTEVNRPPFNIRRPDRTMDITAPYVTSVHGSSWMSELRTMCDAAGSKLAAGERELARSSTPNGPEKRHLHEGDLYLCSESLNALQGALGGVADAVDTIFAPTSEVKHAFVAIRPPGHHCSADYPSGFCWLNNVHIGIEYAAQVHGLTHAAIIDFDLHHGDGSQTIAWERNSKNNVKRVNSKSNSKLKLTPDIGYYSLHDINSYPCENGDDEKVQAASLCIEDAHGQNVWNVHLQPWKNESEFWQLYETKYLVLLEKAKSFLERQTARLRAEGKVRPKAAIFISAGFDASEWEGQGMQRHKVNVPTEFYARFTRDMVQLAHGGASGCDGRVISVLEGGYSDRALCSGVFSHLSGLCTAPAEPKEASDPLGLDQLMRGLAINAATVSSIYNKTWWSSENLTALEMTVNPPPPPAPGKKGRAGGQPTYATPTESFAYKVVDTDRFARSLSGTMREVPRPARPPTPPPPEVDWVTATHELSKLIIPADRRTKSCTAEELGGVRTKKDRQSVAPVLSTAETAKPRQLRDRKAKATSPETVGIHSDNLDLMQSVSRRQTMGDLPPMPSEPAHQRRASRRLSAGSTLSMMSSEVDPTAPPVPTLPAGVTSKGTTGLPKPSVPDLQVKRARAPLKSTKPAASAPTSPTKNKQPPPAPVSSRPAGPSTSKDMDALASGLKKVTLKVGTREEHDRKQKEKLDAERRARALKAAETRKANATAKKAALERGGDKPSPAAGAAVQVKKENGAPIVPPAAPSVHAAPSAAPRTTNVAGAGVQSVQTSQPVETIPVEQSTETQPADTRPSLHTSILPLDGSQDVFYSQNGAPDPAKSDTISAPTEIKPEMAETLPHQHTFGVPVSAAAPATFQLQPPLPPVQSGYAGSELPQPAPPQAPLQAPLPPPPQASLQSPVQAPVRQPVQPPLPAKRPISPIRPSSRDDLPVWSSTGVIPFAPAGNGLTRPSHAGPDQSQMDDAGDGTTLHTHQLGSNQNPQPQPPQPPNFEDDASIWNLPATPSQQR